MHATGESRLARWPWLGEEVVIAKAGTPLVRLEPVEPARGERCGGFLHRQAMVKADFQAGIETMFDA